VSNAEDRFVALRLGRPDAGGDSAALRARHPCPVGRVKMISPALWDKTTRRRVAVVIPVSELRSRLDGSIHQGDCTDSNENNRTREQ